jgi:glucose/arabinose dehydrogenase
LSCHRSILLLLLPVLIASAAGAQTAAPYGLDARPANATCLPFDRPDRDASVRLESAFPALTISDVVSLAQPPRDASYWVFTTRAGVIGRFENRPDVSNWEVVRDLSGPVSVPPDGGLIQLVFHPAFPSDPRIFVNYSVAGSYGEANDIRIASFEMSADGRSILPGSETVLITQPRGTYHQGGFMAFGNDGLLYIGIGDGTDQYPNNRKLDETDLRGDTCGSTSTTFHRARPTESRKARSGTPAPATPVACRPATRCRVRRSSRGASATHSAAPSIR